MSRALKVGDRVRVTEDAAFFADVDAGDIGTLVKDGGDGDWGVRMDDGRDYPLFLHGYHWWIHEDYLEMVDHD